MQMQELVLYRKYRPQVFEDVVGQDHIVTSLKHAVEKAKVAHSYLFVGPRGTGKTTVARILAKAVNCERPKKGSPCTTCAICTEFQEGKSFDLVEIDAASNRGIDEIRELKEAVRYHPYRAKRKIYIIDEVHMLTREAFNALLKTLEEPPEYILFILATTDPERVPDTIRSRAEEFTFRRLSVPIIQARLESIAKKEHVQMEKEVPRLIALLSEGSERDAESMFGQVIAGSEGKINADQVSELFGLPRTGMVAKFVLALMEKNVAQAFSLINTAVEENIDPILLTKLIVEDVRHALHLAIDEKYSEFLQEELSEEHIKFLSDIAKKKGKEELRKILIPLFDAAISPHTGVLPQIPLELAVVDVCSTSIDKLV